MEKKIAVKCKPKGDKSGKVRQPFFTSSPHKENKGENNSSLSLKPLESQKEFLSDFPNIESKQSVTDNSYTSSLQQQELRTLHSSITNYKSLPKPNAKNNSSNVKDRRTLIDQTPNKDSKIKHEEEKEGYLQREEQKQPEEILKCKPARPRVLCSDRYCEKQLHKRGLSFLQDDISMLVIKHAETGNASNIDELEKIKFQCDKFLELYYECGKKFCDCGKYHEVDIEYLYHQKDETQAEGVPRPQSDIHTASCNHSMHLKQTIRRCLVALLQEFFEFVYTHGETDSDSWRVNIETFEHQRCFYLKMLGDVARKCKGNAEVFSLRLD